MYLIGEIAGSLLVAILLGFSIGWMARGRLKRGSVKRRF